MPSFSPDLYSQMPKMCGVEVVQCVRDLGLPTLVVGCTGNALQEDQEEYLAAGANRVLSKPIHQSSIEEVLTEARQRRTQGVLNA
jgi:CheY-like chemotaxis protein